MDDMIFVTQPSLPPLDDYVELLRDIWQRRWLTNKGHYHDRFEQELADYLGVEHVALFCNATIALQVGLQALEISGEVITTPFSFPATTHALWWNHLTPVFCDIDPESCNLDPAGIEALLTPRTTALLPVHVYGNPCDVGAIREVAQSHGLKVFYDAAHAFGVKLKGASVLNHGDLAALSFHATKVFNTAEGGALVTNNRELKERIDLLKNFGIADENTVVAPGTNGKMNELQAALGLVQLRYADATLQVRRAKEELYHSRLAGIAGIRLLNRPHTVTRNGAYMPVFVDAVAYGHTRDDLFQYLKDNGIIARRYFYPLISSYEMYRHLPSAAPPKLVNANLAADTVLCLPLYEQLADDAIGRICDLIRKARG